MAEGTAGAKSWRQGSAWHVWGPAGRPRTKLFEEGGEVRKGTGVAAHPEKALVFTWMAVM